MHFLGSGRGGHLNIDRLNICYFPIRHTCHRLSTRDPTGQKDRIPMHPKHAFDLETAFVSCGTPSLADCIARLRQDETLSRERKRDLISGLNRVAKAINREPATVPADPTWLQPRIAAVAPARNGITLKSWSNIISNAHAALRHLGITANRNRSIERALSFILEGDGDPGSIRAKLKELEARKRDLEHHLTQSDPTPTLEIHPNLGELYRRKVQELHGLLTNEASRPQAMEIIRSLVQRIEVAPGAKRGEAQVTLYGAVASVLDFALGATKAKATACGGFGRVLMVAGAGNHRRLREHRIFV
jgi:hypothetical protein